MSDFKIEVYSLILAVTERCNMRCPHCLRGEARSADMTKEVVDTVLNQVSYISSLVFTGGEPTLNLPIIEYTFDEIRRRRIGLGHFWLATNGLENSLELANILLKNADLCDDIEMAGVAISDDNFHVGDTKKNPLRYLSFYDSSKEGSYKVLNEGMAAENGIGEINKIFSYDFEIEELDSTIVTVDTVFVRPNGDLLAECDMSYEDMDDCCICKAEQFASYVEKKSAS